MNTYFYKRVKTNPVYTNKNKTLFIYNRRQQTKLVRFYSYTKSDHILGLVVAQAREISLVTTAIVADKPDINKLLCGSYCHSRLCVAVVQPKVKNFVSPKPLGTFRV